MCTPAPCPRRRGHGTRRHRHFPSVFRLATTKGGSHACPEHLRPGGGFLGRLHRLSRQQGHLYQRRHQGRRRPSGRGSHRRHPVQGQSQVVRQEIRGQARRRKEG